MSGKGDPPPSSQRRTLLRRAGFAGAGLAGAGVGVDVLAPVLAPPQWSIDGNASYWSRALPAPGAMPIPPRLDADVAIIGGGLTGLSTAWYLREALPDCRVVVVEALRCGNGASARNGAMLLTTTADRYLVAGPDPALDRRLHELTVENIARLRALQERFGIDAEIDTPGALQVIENPGAARAARDEAERLGAAGLPVQWWSAEQTAAAIGTRAFAGALVDRLAGQVHPGRLVALWKRACESAGVLLFEGSAVTQIEEGSPHLLRLASGVRVRAPVLVLASNAYTGRLGYLQRAVAPVWHMVAVTAPLGADAAARLGWSSRAPYNDDRVDPWYLGLTRDNRVHIGGGEAFYGWNGAPPPAYWFEERRRQLHEQLARLYPVLAASPFEAAWSGAVDMSLDARPALGRLEGRHPIYYAIGYSGHGVNLSSVFGRVLADCIAGAQERWAWLPYLNRLPPRIPNEPLRWLGMRAGLALVHTLER
jgi:gamma-glutamylputrescine oxidase